MRERDGRVSHLVDDNSTWSPVTSAIWGSSARAVEMLDDLPEKPEPAPVAVAAGC